MTTARIEARRPFPSPLEGEVAAQRSEGGAAEGFLHKHPHDFGFAEFTPSLTLPPQGGGEEAAALEDIQGMHAYV